MDKKIIARLEELVEEISGCYTSIPEDILTELNDLTKSGWSEEEYIEFCAEYWSRSTLEETVYALLHDGEYPENVECDLYFWNTAKKYELSDEKIMFKLRKSPEKLDKDFICDFEDLPIKEIYSWLQSYYSDWNMSKEPSDEELAANSFKVTFSYDKIEEEEYGKYKYTRLKVHNSKLFALLCCNLSETEKQDILAFAGQHNLHAYED